LEIQVSLPLAFAAGLVSFLSPCVLPVVPSYLAFVSGLTFGEIADRPTPEVRRTAALHSVLFVVGFGLEPPFVEQDRGRVVAKIRLRSYYPQQIMYGDPKSDSVTVRVEVFDHRGESAGYGNVRVDARREHFTEAGMEIPGSQHGHQGHHPHDRGHVEPGGRQRRQEEVLVSLQSCDH